MPPLKKEKPQKDIEMDDLAQKKAREEEAKKRNALRNKVGAEIDFARELYEQKYVKEASAKAFSKISTLLVRYNRMASKSREYSSAEESALRDEAQHYKSKMDYLATLQQKLASIEDESVRKEEEAKINKKIEDCKTDHLAAVEHIKANIKAQRDDANRSMDRDDGAIRGALMLGGNTAFGRGYTLTEGDYLDTMRAGEYINEVDSEKGTLMEQMSLLDNAVNTGGIDLDRGRGNAWVAQKNLGEILREVRKEDLEALNSDSGEKLDLDFDLIEKNRKDEKMDELLGEKQKKLTLDEAAQERGVKWIQEEDKRSKARKKIENFLSRKTKYRKKIVIKSYGLTQEAKDRKAGIINPYNDPQKQKYLEDLKSKANTSFFMQSIVGGIGTGEQRGRRDLNVSNQSERRERVRESRLEFEKMLQEAAKAKREKVIKVNEQDSFDDAMKRLKNDEVSTVRELESLGLDKDGQRELIENEDNIDRVIRNSAMKNGTGTALHMLSAYRMLGASQQELLDFRLALIAYLVPVGKSSVAQIVNESHAAGVVGAEGPGAVTEQDDQAKLFKLLKVNAEIVSRMNDEEGKKGFGWIIDKKKYKSSRLTEEVANPDALDTEKKKLLKKQEDEYRFDRLYRSVISDEDYLDLSDASDEPLFGEKGEIKASDVIEGDAARDSYLCAALAGLAKSDPEYIRTRLVTENEDNKVLVTVRLYDEFGSPHLITVSKKRLKDGAKGPLWVSMVEKAALSMLGQKDQKAVFADKAAAKLDVKDISNGSGDLAMRLLFGKSRHKVISTGYDETDKGEAEEKGKTAIAAIVAAVENNMIITVSTGSLTDDGKRSKVNMDALGLKAEKEYTVTGTGEGKDGKRIIHVRDTYGIATSVRKSKTIAKSPGNKNVLSHATVGFKKVKYDDGVIGIGEDDFLKIFSNVVIASAPDAALIKKEDEGRKRLEEKNAGKKKKETVPGKNIAAGDETYDLEEDQKENEPLFGDDGEIKLSDVRQGDTDDCYLLAALIGLINTDPDYIKTTLVKDNTPDDPSTVTVLLYDNSGMANNITVSKKRVKNGAKEGALWVHMVEKAAAVLVGKTIAEGAGFRVDEAGGEKRSIMDIGKGSEQLAMELLFGKKKHISYKTYDPVTEAQEQKDKKSNADKALEAIKEGLTQKKVIIASTCNRGTSEKYNPEDDSVKLIEGLKAKHEYTVVGLGANIGDDPSIILKDPYGPGTSVPVYKDGVVTKGESSGKSFSIKISDFLRCFSDIAIGAPDKSIISHKEEEIPADKKDEKPEEKGQGTDQDFDLGMTPVFAALGSAHELEMIKRWKAIANPLWTSAYVALGKKTLKEIMDPVDSLMDLLSDIIPVKYDQAAKEELGKKCEKVKDNYASIILAGKKLTENINDLDFESRSATLMYISQLMEMASVQLTSFTRGSLVYSRKKQKGEENKLKPLAYLLTIGEESLREDEKKPKKKPEKKPEKKDKKDPVVVKQEVQQGGTGKKEDDIHLESVSLEAMAKLDEISHIGRWNDLRLKLIQLTGGKYKSTKLNDALTNMEELAEQLQKPYIKPQKGELAVYGAGGSGTVTRLYQSLTDDSTALALELAGAEFDGNDEAAALTAKIAAIANMEERYFQRGRRVLIGEGNGVIKPLWARALVKGREIFEKEEEERKKQEQEEKAKKKEEKEEEKKNEPPVEKAPVHLDINAAINEKDLISRWNDLADRIRKAVGEKNRSHDTDFIVSAIDRLTKLLAREIPVKRNQSAFRQTQQSNIKVTYNSITAVANRLAGELFMAAFEGSAEASQIASVISALAIEERRFFIIGYSLQEKKKAKTWAEVLLNGKTASDKSAAKKERQPVVKDDNVPEHEPPKVEHEPPKVEHEPDAGGPDKKEKVYEQFMEEQRLLDEEEEKRRKKTGSGKPGLFDNAEDLEMNEMMRIFQWNNLRDMLEKLTAGGNRDALLLTLIKAVIDLTARYGKNIPDNENAFNKDKEIIQECYRFISLTGPDIARILSKDASARKNKKAAEVVRQMIDLAKKEEQYFIRGVAAEIKEKGKQSKAPGKSSEKQWASLLKSGKIAFDKEKSEKDALPPEQEKKPLKTEPLQEEHLDEGPVYDEPNPDSITVVSKKKPRKKGFVPDPDEEIGNIEQHLEQEDKCLLDISAKKTGRKSFTPISTGVKFKNRFITGLSAVLGVAFSPVTAAIMGISKLVHMAGTKDRIAGAQKDRSKKNTGEIAGMDKTTLAEQKELKDSEGNIQVFDDVRKIPLVWERVSAGDTEDEPQMSINIEQPKPGKTTASDWGNVGHAFIGLSYSRYNASTQQKERYKLDYGFYPKNGFHGIGLTMAVNEGAFVPGELQDDRNHIYNYSRRYNITNEKINAILKRSENYAAGGYNLASRNCTTFAVEMAETAGLSIAKDIPSAEFDTGGVADAARAGFAGFSQASRYTNKIYLEKMLSSDDPGYQNYGQKMITKEELDRYNDTRGYFIGSQSGYNPALAGETLRRSEDREGETAAKMDLNLSDRYTEANPQEARRLIREIQAFCKDKIKMSKAGDNVECFRQMVLSTMNDSEWRNVEELDGVKDNPLGLKRVYQRLNYKRKNMAVIYTKNPKAFSDKDQEILRLFSVFEDTLNKIDILYEESINKQYKGSLKKARRLYESEKMIINYMDTKDDDLIAVEIEPSIYEAYLQMFGSPKKALSAYMEYNSFSVELDKAKKNGDKKLEKSIEKRMEKSKETYETALSFAASHRYRMNKAEYDEADLKYAFEQLPALEKVSESEVLQGSMIADHMTGASMMQALIFEKAFPGLGDKTNEIEKKANTGEKAKLLDGYLAGCVKEESCRKELKKILKHMVVNIFKPGSSEEEDWKIFFDTFHHSYLVQVLGTALKGEFDIVNDIAESIKSGESEFKKEILDLITEVQGEHITEQLNEDRGIMNVEEEAYLDQMT